MDDLTAVEAAIYDQSFRALDEQARVLDALRARAARSSQAPAWRHEHTAIARVVQGVCHC
jgi:hypothetical protein